MSSDIDRFMAKVKQSASECWEWTACIEASGYSRFKYQGRVQYGHRVSYMMFVGPIPAGLQIDHLCRVRHCVNPDHLEAVTPMVNTQRGEKSQRTHCPQGHEYTPENTHIEAGPKDGWWGRRCRTCHRDRERAAYHTRKQGKE